MAPTRTHARMHARTHAQTGRGRGEEREKENVCEMWSREQAQGEKVADVPD